MQTQNVTKRVSRENKTFFQNKHWELPLELKIRSFSKTERQPEKKRMNLMVF